ncbi:MAG: hypothetical protein EBT62_04295 [Opitutaceae bacterium]|nr:hypothetical protein [Opitutaceae bacterium]
MKTPKRRVVLLGATGSIGASTLRVITAQSDRLELVGIAAHGKYAELATIARQFGVRHVGLYDSAAHTAACRSADFPAGTKFYGGASGLSELATLPEAEIILIAVVGTALRALPDLSTHVAIVAHVHRAPHVRHQPFYVFPRSQRICFLGVVGVLKRCHKFM